MYTHACLSVISSNYSPPECICPAGSLWLRTCSLEMQDMSVRQVDICCLSHPVLLLLPNPHYRGAWQTRVLSYPLFPWGCWCSCRFQLRCLLKQPIQVSGPGATVTGMLRLVAHSRQSYDVHLTLQAPGLQPGQPPQVVGLGRAGMGAGLVAC